MESSFETLSGLLGNAAAACGLICLGDSLADPKPVMALVKQLDALLTLLTPLPAHLAPVNEAAVKSGRGPVSYRGERALCWHEAVYAGVRRFRDELDATADLEAFTLARLSRKQLAPTIIAQNWPAVRKWLRDSPELVDDFQGVGALLKGERIEYAHDREPPKPLGSGKRSSPKVRIASGDASLLILSALRQHHELDDDGGVGNWEPIGVRELVGKLEGKVRRTAISKWFKAHFHGHADYEACCRRKDIGTKLRELGGDLPSRFADDNLG